MSHAFADTCRADTDSVAPQLDALAERLFALAEEMQGFADVPVQTRAYLVQRTSLMALRARAISRDFDGRATPPHTPPLDLEPFTLVAPSAFAGSAVQ